MEIKIEDNGKVIFYIDNKRVYETDLKGAIYASYMISKAITKIMKEN